MCNGCPPQLHTAQFSKRVSDVATKTTIFEMTNLTHNWPLFDLAQQQHRRAGYYHPKFSQWTVTSKNSPGSGSMETVDLETTMPTTELDEIDFGLEFRSRRTSTEATCWAGERLSKKFKSPKAINYPLILTHQHDTLFVTNRQHTLTERKRKREREREREKHRDSETLP